MNRVSICLSDIPREKLRKATNGKIYVNLIVAERREPDQFGNDLTVYVDQSKEEREAKAERVYVGAGRNYTFTQTPVTPEAVDQLPGLNANDDLAWAEPATKID